MRDKEAREKIDELNQWLTTHCKRITRLEDMLEADAPISAIRYLTERIEVLEKQAHTHTVTVSDEIKRTAGASTVSSVPERFRRLYQAEWPNDTEPITYDRNGTLLCSGDEIFLVNEGESRQVSGGLHDGKISTRDFSGNFMGWMDPRDVVLWRRKED